MIHIPERVRGVCVDGTRYTNRRLLYVYFNDQDFSPPDQVTKLLSYCIISKQSTILAGVCTCPLIQSYHSVHAMRTVNSTRYAK